MFPMYIDPNTGGMLFQILAILFGTFSAIILFFSGRIRMLFARFRRASRERDGESGSADETVESVESEDSPEA